MGIHRDTVDDRKSRFARKACSMSVSFKRVHMESMRESGVLEVVD
jgi:hypothetical protein